MANKFENMFYPGALAIPEKLLKKQSFKAAATFNGPGEIIADFYLTPVENQGSNPWCAAFAATTYAESILWRKNGYHKDIDPEAIYRYCKTVDGDPDGDGTTLTAAMDALLAKGYFDKSVCKVKTFGGLIYGNGGALNTLKYAVHRYGVVEIGLDIDSSWYSPRKGVISGDGQELGGHAVVCAGYDQDGFIICNSWGIDWGHDGKAYVPNAVMEREFLYSAILTHALDGLE